MKKIISVLMAAVIAGVSLAAASAAVSAESGVPLPGLYNAGYYSTYGASGFGASFDVDGQKITTKSPQFKAMLNYSTDMTTFDSTVTIAGNPTTGLIYGGVSFHIQQEDFKNASFNTAGYSVLLVRGTSNVPATSVQVLVRYCSGNNVYKNIASVITKNAVSGTDTALKLRLELSVGDEEFTVRVYNVADHTRIGEPLTYPLDYTADYPTTSYYPSGAFGLLTNGIHTFSELSIVSTGNMQNIPVDLSEKYRIYGAVSADGSDGFFSASEMTRGVLKDKTVTDFSAEAQLRVSESGTLKGGIIFRTGSVSSGTDNMEGYAAVLWKKTSSGTDYNRVVLLVYKYGIVDGAYKYLGTVGSVANTTVLGYWGDAVDAAAGQVLTLHINVVGTKIEADFYGNTDPNDPAAVRRSQTLSISLNSATDVEKNNPGLLEKGIQYSSGGIGFYLDQGNEMNLLGLSVGAAEPLRGGTDEPAVYPGGRPASDTARGSAVGAGTSTVAQLTPSEITAPGVADLAAYSSNFDHYTLYSSGTTKLMNVGNTLLSETSGTKRAMLDGVTVKGFHAELRLKIGAEGTLRSGLLFRVNDIEAGLAENGTLGSNDIEGYSIVLYKTPGSTDDQARVVMCVYKYGIVNGKYTYLGTVGSKASSVPLTGCSKAVADAAGEELTLSVNVIGDELAACFYNTARPSLISDVMTVDLNGVTDIEGTTPSMSGIHYDSGAIGVTVNNYAAVTALTITEPLRPSELVGDLSYLESYTVYSPNEGVSLTDGYFTAESSGTKKMIVNNLTVSDFTASVNMVIDPNGNLKSGIIFRANDIGNSTDAMAGYAIAVSRNYSTLGETNPNRIDVVVFKWGYQNGKLAYLGEVAREAYKSGASFMDGKMAGRELTLIVKVSGASLDATVRLADEPDNSPITFSTNLKFAASNEKGETAYYESGSIGLFLGNSVSDPLNRNQLRNFHIDDGSGVRVLAGQGVSGGVVGVGVSSGSSSPTTGEGRALAAALTVFCISVASAAYIRFVRRRKFL